MKNDFQSSFFLVTTHHTGFSVITNNFEAAKFSTADNSHVKLNVQVVQSRKDPKHDLGEAIQMVKLKLLKALQEDHSSLAI